MIKGRKFRLAYIVTIGLFIYFGWILIDQQKIIYSMEQQKKIMETNIEEEKKLNEELKKQKEIVGSDDLIEKIAREKLGMVKKGEKIFVDTNK